MEYQESGTLTLYTNILTVAATKQPRLRQYHASFGSACHLISIILDTSLGSLASKFHYSDVSSLFLFLPAFSPAGNPESLHPRVEAGF